jgi:hypothetical protein
VIQRHADEATCVVCKSHEVREWYPAEIQALGAVAILASTPAAGSFGVVRTLPTRAVPVASSMTTRSVKVPPMSTPRRASMAEVYDVPRVSAPRPGSPAPHCRAACLGSVYSSACAIRSFST